MKIGFDAKRYFNNHTGLGNYSRSLHRAFLENRPKDQFYLYSPKVSKEFEELFKLNSEFARTPTNNKLLWRQWGVVKELIKDEIDVFHGLSAELPINLPKSIKSVVTIHDVIYKRYPENYKATDRFIYHQKTKSAIERSDAIIAISQVTKNDLVEFYDIDPDKCHVIPVMAGNILGVILDPFQYFDLLDNYPLKENKKYALCVSKFEKRKNHLRMLEAFRRAMDEVHYDLILVGPPGDTAPLVEAFIKKHHMDERVHIFYNFPQSKMHALYGYCDLTIMPSVYEGFGMPAMESICTVTPMAAGKGTSMEEILGNTGTYFDPLDPDSIADALVMMNSQAYRDEKISGYSKQIKKFIPKTVVKQHFKLYKSLLKK